MIPWSARARPYPGRQPLSVVGPCPGGRGTKKWARRRETVRRGVVDPLWDDGYEGTRPWRRTRSGRSLLEAARRDARRLYGARGWDSWTVGEVLDAPWQFAVVGWHTRSAYNKVLARWWSKERARRKRAAKLVVAPAPPVWDGPPAALPSELGEPWSPDEAAVQEDLFVGTLA